MLQIRQQNVANLQQLSLWDTNPDTKDEEDISSRGSTGIILMPTGWADGDTSPQALERLAIESLGEMIGGLYEEASGETLLNYHLYAEVLKASRRRGYVKVLYRVITTSVIGEKVWCACEYVSPMNEYYGWSSSSSLDDEEEVA